MPEFSGRESLGDSQDLNADDIGPIIQVKRQPWPYLFGFSCHGVVKVWE